MKKRSQKASSVQASNGGKLDFLIQGQEVIKDRTQAIDTRTKLTEQSVVFIKERIIVQEDVNKDQEKRIRVNSAYRENFQGKVAVVKGVLTSKIVLYVGGGSLLAVIGKVIHHLFTPGH